MRVPNAWSVQLLEQVAEIRIGIALGKRPAKDPISVPYLRVANVQDGYLNLREIKQIDIERQQLARYSLQIGDVLLTEGGDADKLGRGDVWQGQVNPCLHQNHVFAVRTKRDVLLPEYLNALTASQYGRAYFLRCAKKSTNLASINSSQLKQFPVLLPPLAAQQKIVEILACWDQAIACSDALLANSLAQQAACYQFLFQIQAQGQSWRSAALAELAALDPHSLPRSTPADFRFRYIQLANVARGKILGSLQEYTMAQAPSRARRLLHTGDILLATVRPNLQGFARVDAAHAGCVASTGFTVLAVKPRSANEAGISSDYLYHYLFAPHFSQQIERLVSGTNYPQLNNRDIAKLAIHFPPAAEQARISQLLDQQQQRVALEQRARQLLLQQKQQLMEQFLCGQILPAMP